MARIAIISGGTATNELVPLFNSLLSNITYVLPILDNGGSTSEIIRVIGGPAIGDIRSRLTRLIPKNQSLLCQLLSYRLSGDPIKAKSEWNQLVEGVHPLWKLINPATKEIIRAFFIHVHTELLRRLRQLANKQYRYELANVGNLCLTGMRTFVGSLDLAIELFSRITGINPDVEVLPCINTNFTYHISAMLENGVVITGQSQISHPSQTESYPPVIKRTRPGSPVSVVSPIETVGGDGVRRISSIGSMIDELELDESIYKLKHDSFTGSQYPSSSPQVQVTLEAQEDEENEDDVGIPQYTHPDLRKSQLHFDKSNKIAPLLSPIDRIFYISPYGEEILPSANNRVCVALSNSDTVVYLIGSLMTSIVPVLILRGIGKTLAANKRQKKILLLNGSYDRETEGMDAIWFINVIVKLCMYSMGKLPDTPILDPKETLPWSSFVTHIVHLKDPLILVKELFLKEEGIQCVEVQSQPGNPTLYDSDALEQAIKGIMES